MKRAALWILAVNLASTLILGGCGKPFNVLPKTELPPANFAATARSGTVEVQAEAMTDEDVIYHIFNANLIMAGLLPVRIKISNTGQAALSLRKVRFSVKSADGGLYESVSGSRAFKRLMTYYEIQNYQKYGYHQSRDDFISYSLDVGGPLARDEQRSGIVFFRIPPDKAREPGLSIKVAHLKSDGGKNAGEVNLKLN